MEQQLPVALQVALYAASVAIVAILALLVGAMLRSDRRLGRLVGAVEELKLQVEPLARESRVVVARLGDLTGRAQEQWKGVEGIVGTARRWTERADHLVDEIGSVVEPPVFATTDRLRGLRRGLGVFVKVLLSRDPPPPRQGTARDVREGASVTNSPISIEGEEDMSDVIRGSGSSVMVAAVVGAAVGAGVALLFAPCSGKETRGWIASRSREVKDKTSSAFAQGVEATRRAVNEIGKGVEEATAVHERPMYAESGAPTVRR